MGLILSKVFPLWTMLIVGRCDQDPSSIDIEHGWAIYESPDHNTDYVNFYSHKVDINYWRLYFSPCDTLPVKEIRHALSFHQCKDMKSEENIRINMKYFEDYCNGLWQEKMNEIRSALELEPEHKPIKYMSDLDKWGTTIKHRSKRDLSLAFGIISTGAALINAIKSSVEIYHMSKRIDEHEKATLEIIEDYKKEHIEYAEMSSFLSDDLRGLGRAFCAQTSDMAKMHGSQIATKVIDDYMAHTMEEVLSINRGLSPLKLDYYYDMIRLCRQLNPTNRFCQLAYRNNLIETSYRGVVLADDNSLQLLISIKLPIEVKGFWASKLSYIANTGYFKDGHYLKFDLPKAVVLTDTEHSTQIMTIDPSLCQGPVCSYSAVSFDQTTKCVSALLANNTDFCTATDYGPAENICDFHRIGNDGNLITVSKAELTTEHTSEFPNIRKIDLSTTFLSEDATLSCLTSHGKNTIRLQGTLAAQYRAIKMKTYNYPEFLNITQEDFEIHKSLPFKVHSNIKDLKRSDDNILLGSTQLPTLALIGVGFFISILFSCLYTHRATLTTCLISASSRINRMMSSIFRPRQNILMITRQVDNSPA